MAAAMPVIATNIDGTRELVQDGETGWLFPPGDDKALANIMLSILNKKKNIFSAGLAGRCFMKNEKLTWGDTAKRYRDLYSNTKR